MSGRVASAVRRLSTSLRQPWGGPRGPDEPPVVRGVLPFLGCALPFGRDAPALLLRSHARHGDAFSLHLLGRRMTFLMDPRDYPLLFKHGRALSFTPIAHEISTRAFGYRTVYRSGLTDQELRDVYAHHLRPNVVGPLADRVAHELVRVLDEQIEAAPAGPGQWRELDLMALVTRCMFEAGVVAMFGRGSFDEALQDRFVRFDRQFGKIVAGVPLRLLGSVREDREALVESLRASWPDASAFIEEHRAVLSRHVDDLEAARVRLSMLWASQANTVPAAFWAVALLVEHPSALAEVVAEVDGVATHGSAPSHADQPRLDSAITETLRLCAGSTTLRTVLEPVTLELVSGRRCALRPGDHVAVFPYLSHRDPEVFEDPEAFRHDRFVSERGARQFYKGGQRLGFPVMPFGGGETMCPGRFLAHREIKALVTTLLANHELEAIEGQSRPAFDLSRSGLGILPPVGSLRVRVRPRGAA